jgi:hypothetical protein
MTKPQTRAKRLAAYFLTRPGEFVSVFTVQRFSPLGHSQEISRVRQQFGMTLEHEWRKRGKVRMSGWVYRPAKARKAA